MTSIHCAGGKFVGRKNVADFVVENSAAVPGSGAQAVIAQHRKIVGERHAG